MGWSAAQLAIDRERDLLSCRDERSLPLGHAQPQSQRIVAQHRDHARSGLDEAAARRMPRFDAAPKRRHELCVRPALLREREFDLALRQLREPRRDLLFGRLQSALRHRDGRHRRVQRGLAAESLAREFAHAIAREPSLDEHGPRFANRRALRGIDRIAARVQRQRQSHARHLQRRLGACAFEIEVGEVERRDALPRRDRVADVDVERQDAARDLEAEVRRLIGRERSGHFDLRLRRQRRRQNLLHRPRLGRRLRRATRRATTACRKARDARCEQPARNFAWHHEATTRRSLQKRSAISCVNGSSGCRTTIQPSPTITLRQSRRGSPIGVSSRLATCWP